MDNLLLDLLDGLLAPLVLLVGLHDHALVAVILAAQGQLAVGLLTDAIIVNILVVFVNLSGQLDLLKFVKRERDGRFFGNWSARHLGSLDALGVGAGALDVVHSKDDVLMNLFVH